MKVGAIAFHRQFDKSYSRQIPGVKEAFIERKNLFLIDPFHPLLNNHPLKGKWLGFRSINITGDIRAVYKLEGNVAIFVEIGSHPYLYDM